jgi:hypothetical protein
MEAIMQEIDELKAEISMCLGMADTLSQHVGRGKGGREISLTITQLQQASHWLRDVSELLQGPAQGNSDGH